MSWGLYYFLFLFFFPFKLGDPEIIIEANFIISPVHIVPEWYFLFAYAILRAIPNKILGVLALLFRIILFYFFYFLNTIRAIYDKLNKFLFFFSRLTVKMVRSMFSWAPFCFFKRGFNCFVFFICGFNYILILIY